MKAALPGAVLLPAALTVAPTAHAGLQIGHYNAYIDGRYDFHTWIFTFVSRAPPTAPAECARVSANPMPIAKAFQWYATAHQANGVYRLVVDARRTSMRRRVLRPGDPDPRRLHLGCGDVDRHAAVDVRRGL